MARQTTAEQQDRLFLAHLADLFEQAEKQYVPRFTSFLDLHQQSLARRAAASSGYGNHAFSAGYPDGERVMLGVFAPYGEPEPFPIVPVTLRFREEDAIGHRDILGSLMGLEIRRESVGDILVGPGIAVLFVSAPVAPVILSELRKVGRCGVKVSEGRPETLPPAHEYRDLPVNVSSLRLDCLVSAVTNLSREKSAQMIRAQLVSLNGQVVQETSRPVTPGDVLSVRGHGKFLFACQERATKKGRLQLLCKKYI